MPNNSTTKPNNEGITIPVDDQLQAILRERIKNSVCPRGTKFPSESDLLEEFDVSRITVRRA